MGWFCGSLMLWSCVLFFSNKMNASEADRSPKPSGYDYDLYLDTISIADLNQLYQKVMLSLYGNPDGVPLYTGESYLPAKNGGSYGNSSTEQQRLVELVADVVRVQREIARSEHGGRPDRVFHQKGQGCLVGQLNILKTNDGSFEKDYVARVSRGIFSQDLNSPVGGKPRTDRDSAELLRSYNVIARFSNGVGFSTHDKEKDVRGLAVKIFGAIDQLSGKSRTLDFLLTNSPTPAAKDVPQFVEFMNLTQKYGVSFGTLSYLYRNNTFPDLPDIVKEIILTMFPDMVKEIILTMLSGKSKKDGTNKSLLLDCDGKPGCNLLKTTATEVGSLANIQYWGGHPYLMGEITNANGETRLVQDLAMKITFVPEDSSGDVDSSGEKEKEPNYLSADLQGKAQKKQIRFTVKIQLDRKQRGEDQESIENALIEWKTPLITVGELVFDQQNPAQNNGSCDSSVFSPGHFLPVHRPLGMGRARIFPYLASAWGRLNNGFNGVDGINVVPNSGNLPQMPDLAESTVVGLRQQAKSMFPTNNIEQK